MTDHPRKRLEELFEGYVEDRLSPRELEEFERLAPLEPGLAERARQEAELVRALREEGRAAKAPVDLMAGVRRAMEAESKPLRPVRIRRTWMPLAAAAALAAMVAGGGALMLSQRGGDPGRYDIAMDMRRTEEPARTMAPFARAPGLEERLERLRVAPPAPLPSQRGASSPRRAAALPDREPFSHEPPTDEMAAEPPGDLWSVRNGRPVSERDDQAPEALEVLLPWPSREEAVALARAEGARVLLDTRWPDTALAIAGGEEEFPEGRFNPDTRFLVVEPLERKDFGDELLAGAFRIDAEDTRVESGRAILAYRSEPPAPAVGAVPPPPPALETDVRSLPPEIPFASRRSEEDVAPPEADGLQDYRHRDLSRRQATPPPPSRPETEPAPHTTTLTERTLTAPPSDDPHRQIETLEGFVDLLVGGGGEFLFRTTDRRTAFVSGTGPDLPEDADGELAAGRDYLVIRFAEAEHAEAALRVLRHLRGPGVVDLELHAVELLYEDEETARLIVPRHIRRGEQ